MNIEIDGDFLQIALALGNGDAKSGIELALRRSVGRKKKLGRAVQEGINLINWAFREKDEWPAAEFFSTAEQIGISRMSLIRAKNVLGVKSYKVGALDKGKWIWRKPVG